MKQKEFLILTSTLGGKDKLLDPTHVFDSCDYIAIVDEDHNTNVWKQHRNYNFSSIDNFSARRNAKIYKVLSSILFSQYKYIVWHDANFEITIDPVEIIKEYGEYDFYTLQHPTRNCSYQEMKVIQSSGKDDSITVQNQLDYYHSQNFPKNYGLYAMGNIIRKVNSTITTLELKWWEHITKYSSRDQCSFMYSLWDMKRNDMVVNVKALDGSIDNNTYFRKKGPHLK